MFHDDEHYRNRSDEFTGAWKPPSLVTPMPAVPFRLNLAGTGIDYQKIMQQPLQQEFRKVSSFSAALSKKYQPR